MIALESARWPLFLAASAVLILTPGPAVLYIVARSMSQGRAAGLVSALGVGVGNFVHAVAAALGLSAILASSSAAFATTKYLGAAYLVFLGVRKFLSRSSAGPELHRARQPLAAVFRQGLLVGTFNPKTALFFLAFLPQFAVAGHGPVWRQLLVFGVVFVAFAVISDSAYAVLSGAVGRWLQRRRTFVRGEKYVSGAVYCGLGVAAAMSGSPRQP
jgi:threonine/homoserine/homoserine lactone efflux protein